MDQYPFEFTFCINGIDVDDFIVMLDNNGLTAQADIVRAQYNKQLKEL